MSKKLRVLLGIVITLSMLLNYGVGYAAAAGKSVNVIIKPSIIKVNSKVAKIDCFSYGNKIFVQPQDLSSLLNLEYTYNEKKKTLSMNNKKPAKQVAMAKSKFTAEKASAAKALKAEINTLKITIDGKPVKSDNLIYDGAVFMPAKDLAGFFLKDFILGTTDNTLTINEKKSTKPSLAQDIKEQTEGNVTVTIANWGNATIKEYKLGEGAWQKYSSPVVMTANDTISARGTNAAGITSDISGLEVSNIHKILSKVDVSKKNVATVKIVLYDANNVEIGTGSGFFISSDGKVATNYHVIDMVTHIKVLTTDGKGYDVLGVLGYSKWQDISILKLDTKDTFPYLKLGNSDQLSLGEDVVAIGYPLGLPVTVSFGNVSSLNAEGGANRKFFKDIQFTASISHGNSGGPLFNMYGEVVGINYSSIFDGQNLNFSIPINELKPLVEVSTLTSPEDVIKQVYPKMSYDDYAGYLYCNDPDFKAGAYTFGFTGISIQEYSKDPQELDVYVDMSAQKFTQVLLADTEDNRKEMEKWADDLYKKVKEKFPDKNVYLVFALFDSFASQPTGYANDEIRYNENTGRYEVYKVKLIYYYENNAAVAMWK